MNHCLRNFIVFICGIIFGALAIQTVTALIGVSVATAFGHPGMIVLGTFYCWPVFWLAAFGALCIMITRGCFCFIKAHICCKKSCDKGACDKGACDTKPTKVAPAAMTTPMATAQPAVKTAAKKAPVKKPAAKKTPAKK